MVSVMRNRSYYTDDLEDARSTKAYMEAEEERNQVLSSILPNLSL